ncbi:MAG: hypothetical protein M3Y76_13925, partial [Chloroflexota bacterium]|nr:hypothetical protein [Chloroflexota bacterium]
MRSSRTQNGSDYSYLTTLPDPDRRRLNCASYVVMLLRYETQLSYRETGRALRIPTTAKTYFYR